MLRRWRGSREELRQPASKRQSFYGMPQWPHIPSGVWSSSCLSVFQSRTLRTPFCRQLCVQNQFSTMVEVNVTWTATRPLAHLPESWSFSAVIGSSTGCRCVSRSSDSHTGTSSDGIDSERNADCSHLHRSFRCSPMQTWIHHLHPDPSGSDIACSRISPPDDALCEAVRTLRVIFHFGFKRRSSVDSWPGSHGSASPQSSPHSPTPFPRSAGKSHVAWVVSSCP
jgi:hypothetical protein